MEIVARQQSMRVSPVRGRTVDCCFGRSLWLRRPFVHGHFHPEGVHRAYLNTEDIQTHSKTPAPT